MHLLKKGYLLFALLCLPGLVLAKNKVTLSGYVKDAASGETLIGAAVFVKDASTGVSTNQLGFYSLTLPSGTYTIKVSYMGFETQQKTLNLIADKTHNFELKTNYQTLDKIVVHGKSEDYNVRSTQMGEVSLDIAKIKKLPVLFGETDIMKTLQLLPGVLSAQEGTSGFNVRGGAGDQNLVLLDGATIYNTGHLLGFFSVFNGDAVKNVTLIKGVPPANYGGRLSAVVDVQMKDGNKKHFHGTGGIGLISSRLTLEGPIAKNKSSFMLAGRRTYIDVLTKPFIKGKMKGTGYYFYDLNLKADLIAGKKDHVYLSGYMGKDAFTFHSKSGSFNADMPWGNKIASVRWSHQFSPKLFLNTTGIYNRYDISFKGGMDDLELGFKSGIRDWTGKLDFDYYLSPKHHIQFGGQFTNHKLTPNQASGNSGPVQFNPDNAFTKQGNELGIYILDKYTITNHLKIDVGLRYSWFGQMGPYDYFKTNGLGQKVDSISYAKGQLVKGYQGLAPRLSARYQFDNNSSIKLGIGKTYQYLARVSNNGTTFPTDIWVPATKRVKPLYAWQYSVGYFRNFFNNKLETSVELYYRDLYHQIEYRSGYTPTSFNDPELDFVFGKGQAYGAEFLIRKTKGHFTGWIAYTLSWTWRKFPDLNNGQPFPAKYDRRNDLNIVVSYDLNKKWNFSAVFVYATGNAITLPTGYYFVGNGLVENYSKINSYRIFPYNRLDLSITYDPHPERKGKGWHGTWNLSVYNVYNRKNPFFLYVDKTGSLSTGLKVQVKEVSVFPIIPSISYSFKF